MLPINLKAVAVSALAAFFIGFMFHGPLFGKLWMKLAKIQPTGNEKFSDMVPQMVFNMLANLVTAFVLAVIFLFASGSPYLAGSGVWRGVVCAVWVWGGFLVTSSSIEVIWMGRSVQLWLFETVASLVVMSTMGAIIAAWP